MTLTIPWSELRPVMNWEAGEHVTIVGHTGSGKTHLGLALLPQRSYSVVLATKPRDPILAPLKKEGYSVARDMRSFDRLRKRERIVLWPKAERLDGGKHQTDTFHRFFEYLYRTGNRAVFADELYYLTNHLGLSGDCKMLLTQGRTLGVSFVTATQRPFHVPLEAYSQATHLFLFRENDQRNLKRMEEIGGVDTRLLKNIVTQLPKRHFLYVNTRDTVHHVSKVQREVEKDERNESN